MYDRTNEEIMWTRLVDLQREMENSRFLLASGAPPAVAAWRRLVSGVRWLGSIVFEADARAIVRDPDTAGSASEDAA